MNLFFSTIGALLFLSLSVSANTTTQLEITQNSSGLQITALISGQHPKTFVLQKSARMIATSGFVITTTNEGEFLLKTLSSIPASITYELNVDLSRVNYFLEDQNWYPREDSNKLQETQEFYLKIKTETGFEVIHSAIGKSPEGVSMVFGAFKKYTGSKINIFLQKTDDTLANTLITALDKYLKHYEEKIGPYPYEDFSVVESSDEIGYAFPRMTWIGSKLLRFPFILTTSLPHELLHSWWGNGVFVDHASGNWCEGLTTYGADYGLLDDSAKLNYRRKILTEYADYVKNGSEISLAQFVSRGEDKSLQAIGYGKSAIMFLMLEDLVGSDSFGKAIKSFFLNYKTRKATYRNFFSEVAAHTNIDNSILNHFYDQWVSTPGAVSWHDIRSTVIPPSATTLTTVKIEMQDTDAQRLLGLSVDFKFQFKDGSVLERKVPTAFNAIFEFALSPFTYSIDPNFRIFRTLADGERPLNFSRFFGSDSAQILANAESTASAAQVFSGINLQAVSSLGSINFDQNGIILIENYQGGSHLIDQALLKANIKLKPDTVQIQNENISLVNNAYFISVSVGSKIGILFNLNSSLPLNRWYERWSRYGAQGYVVLTPTSALKQGLTNVAFERPLQTISAQ